MIKRHILSICIFAVLFLILPLGTFAEGYNVSFTVTRFEMGDTVNANKGSYFIFNGQEELLSTSTSSCAILARWSREEDCFVVTSSLGYGKSKVNWDIPADGFAFMISAYTDENASRTWNMSDIEEVFDSDGDEKTDLLKGERVYLYGVDLNKGTLEISDDSRQGRGSAYITVGKPDDTSKLALFSGDTFLVDRSIEEPQPVTAFSRLYLSGYSAIENETNGLYGQCFLVMPDDKSIDDILENSLWASACVIENRGADGYYVVHTAARGIKNDWKEKWLSNPDGSLRDDRFLLVCNIMNDRSKHPDICDFEMLNWETAYYKLNPSEEWGGNGEEGAAIGLRAYFYNVNFSERTAVTFGEWATPGFVSSALVTFGVENNDSVFSERITNPATTETTRVTTSITSETKEGDNVMDAETYIAVGVTSVAVLLLFVTLVIRYRRKNYTDDI